MSTQQPIITLESGVYADKTSADISNIQNITITQSVCTLNFSYIDVNGDGLKYYRFYLYDEYDNLLGMSNKVYSLDGIEYTIENYNNLKKYKLKLYCETQSNIGVDYTIGLYTNYDQQSIYADIAFSIDKQKATNNVSVNIAQLTGTGQQYTYADKDYVVIANDGYVNFVDKYKTINNNFICKLWCKQLSNNALILEMKKLNDNDYIKVYFVDNAFRAYKYSCGVTTFYVSNTLEISEGIDIKTADVYFAIREYNGRIDMYTTIIS